MAPEAERDKEVSPNGGGQALGTGTRPPFLPHIPRASLDQTLLQPTRPRCDFSPGCRRLVFLPALLCRINTTTEAGKRQERGACRVSPRSSTSGGVMTAWPQGRAPCPLSGATQGCDTGTGGSAAQAEPRLAEPGGLPRAGKETCIGLRPGGSCWGDEPSLSCCPQPKALLRGAGGARWKQQAACQTHPRPSCFAHPAQTPFSEELGLRMCPDSVAEGLTAPSPAPCPRCRSSAVPWPPPVPVPSSRV